MWHNQRESQVYLSWRLDLKLKHPESLFVKISVIFPQVAHHEASLWGEYNKEFPHGLIFKPRNWGQRMTGRQGSCFECYHSIFCSRLTRVDAGVVNVCDKPHHRSTFTTHRVARSFGFSLRDKAIHLVEIQTVPWIIHSIHIEKDNQKSNLELNNLERGLPALALYRELR